MGGNKRRRRPSPPSEGGGVSGIRKIKQNNLLYGKVWTLPLSIQFNQLCTAFRKHLPRKPFPGNSRRITMGGKHTSALPLQRVLPLPALRGLQHTCTRRLRSVLRLLCARSPDKISRLTGPNVRTYSNFKLSFHPNTLQEIDEKNNGETK